MWLVLIAYLLPDGHAASSRQRTWIRLGLVGNVVFWVGAAGDPSLFEPDPLPVAWLPTGVSSGVGVVGLIWVVVFFFGSVVSVLLRLRGSTGDDRLRLLWFLFGALSVPAALLLNWASYFFLDDPSPLAPFVGALVMCALPVAIGIAIVRTRLFDIELVLSRTLTYGVLTALVFGAYAGLLALAGSTFGNSTLGGICAIAVVAVAAAPTQRWLRDRIERWVYGYRSEPHRAIRMMSERVDAADPLDLLPAITDTVTEALSVQRAWFEQDGPSTPATNVVRAPLVHQGTPLGSLAVEIPPGRSFSPGDTQLLHDLARQAAVLVRAGQLNADLMASRSRLVTTREEERKRLRHDLHDGLGPSLAAIVLKLNAAATRTDATERTALLAEIRDEVKDAIAEIRRVVDDLRPPAIDEVGLLGALRQRAAVLSTETLQYVVDRTGLTATRSGRGRGRCVPDRLRGHDQRRQALRREPLHHRHRDRRDPRGDRHRQRPRLAEADRARSRVDLDDRPRLRARRVLHDLEPRRRRACRTRRASAGRGCRRAGERVTRVLVADDHPAFRRGLELMLDDVDDVEIVGFAETGAKAVDLTEKLSPDVVLMDLRMPDLDGIEATRRINRLDAAPAVVVLTMFEDDDSVFAAMRAGARGYLLKGADQDEIVRAVRAAAAGEAIFGPEIAARVIRHFASGSGSNAAAFPALTEREREVLELIAAGKGNATIAHELMISLKTVRNHVSNIFTKLQVSDRSAAIVKAREAGLGGGS